MRLLRTLASVGGDRRSHASGRALERFLAEAQNPRFALGGGPTRVAVDVRNLNIAPVGNVDLLGDAHRLPFEDGSVGGFHCEAVLEHLESPELAVAEARRCLGPGGLVFSATPFLQPFHGYPSHFRNFTLVGHEQIFREAGFELLDSGCCVGPAFAIADLIRFFLREVWPAGGAGRILGGGWWLLSQPLRLLDHRLSSSSRGAAACSTTFVLARKRSLETP